MRCFTRISFGWFLVVLCLAIGGRGTPAISEGGTYGSTTRAAIDQIIKANDEAVSGKIVDAQNLLRWIAEPLKNLEGLAQKFREVANREHDRCMLRIGELETKTSDLYQQQLELNDKIKDLDAQLAGAAKRRDLAAAEIERLRANMAASEQSMREREAKLSELAKWWWVPGYGAYLGIRTLVDNDIGQYQSAVSALSDQQKQLQQHAASLDRAQALRAQLDPQKQQGEALHRQLDGIRSSAQNELRELKGTAVFLTDADVFWGKAETLVQVDANGFIGTMQILQDVLERDVQAPSFTDPSHEVVRDFRQKLLELPTRSTRTAIFCFRILSDRRPENMRVSVPEPAALPAKAEGGQCQRRCPRRRQSPRDLDKNGQTELDRKTEMRICGRHLLRQGFQRRGMRKQMHWRSRMHDLDLQ